MVHLTTVGGTFHGRVLVARLAAEGISSQLRGANEGPYPIMGPVEVFVAESQVEEARKVLLADAVDAAFDESVVPPEEAGATAGRPGLRPALLLLALLVVIALLGTLHGL